MFAIFFKALDQFSDPATRRVSLQSLGFTLAVFAGLWLVVWFLLANTALFSWWWLETVVDFLGWMAALVITWLLFPSVISAFTCFMLDRVANAVEARHYPNLSAPRQLSFGESLLSAVKFLIIMLVLNMALLMFLIIPPLFPFVFYGVNGYLLSREYFEMVAMRRVGAAQATKLRKAHRGQLLMSGVLIAMMLTMPVINLLTPIVATAVMIHFFESWREHEINIGLNTELNTGTNI